MGHAIPRLIAIVFIISAALSPVGGAMSVGGIPG
jgi:hypothetical protein